MNATNTDFDMNLDLDEPVSINNNEPKQNLLNNSHKIRDSFLQENEEFKFVEVTYKKEGEKVNQFEEENVVTYENNKKFSERIYDDIDNNICLNLFNPPDLTSYNFIRNNWLKVILNILILFLGLN